MGLLSAGGVVRRIVDEMRRLLEQWAQYFFAAADEVAVSTLAQPAAERPEVAVVRHPIADARNNVVGYELRFGGSVDLGDPAMDARGRPRCSSTRSATSGSSSSPAATPRG
jgi:hypothetical protein